MQKIKTLIIEDEASIRKEIEWLVSQHHQLEICGMAGSVEGSLPLFAAIKPDLVLMDIQLTDGTAFDILSQLGEVDFHIVFMTAFNHFAVKAIKFGALDYLLKPIEEEEFALAIKRVEKENNKLLYNNQLHLAKSITKNIEINLNTQICIASSDFLQLIKLGDIVFCKSEGSYTEVYTQNQKKIVASKSLKYYEEILPSEWFVRTHQSYIINKLYVDKLHKSGVIIMQNEKEIPIATRRKEMVIEQIISIKG